MSNVRAKTSVLAGPGRAGLAAPAAAPVEVAPAGRGTYGEILRSTLLIGGSSGVGLLVGLVRAKAMAVMLGPAGFGLMGIYTSIFDLARTAAELGINGSGVRQMAESVASGDERRVRRTAAVLRRAALGLGLAGAVALMLLANPISVFTFGDDSHAVAVMLLGLAVLVRLVADGYGALLQGTRRIADIAKIAVAGAVLGTMAALPLVYVLGEDGVVPAIIASAVATLAATWWYVRRAPIEGSRVLPAELRSELATLVKLGSTFMVSSLVAMLAAYAVRLFVLQADGSLAAGLYQSAWTLAVLYVGFVLHAMGTDFYPRLVGVIRDPVVANRLVNEQAQVSMLLACPGVIVTLTFASVAIEVLYSSEFLGAVEVLRWICLGMALRVVSWPMGYILVACNRKKLLLAVECTWAVVNIGGSFLLVNELGLLGAGIAFFASYVVHVTILYPIVHRLTGFRWSADNRRLICIFALAIAGVFVALETLPHGLAVLTGCVGGLLTAFISLRTLIAVAVADVSRMPRNVHRILKTVRLV